MSEFSTTNGDRRAPPVAVVLTLTMRRSTGDDAVRVIREPLLFETVMMGPAPAFGRGLLTTVVVAPGAVTIGTIDVIGGAGAVEPHVG